MSKDRVQHRHVDSVDHTGDDKPATFQRVEVITGIGRRRRFSPDAKARIVRESRAPGAVISEVARRHGLTPQQLFGWRRQLRQAMSAAAPALAEVATAPTSAFTPVVVAAEAASATAGRDQTEACARRTIERMQVEITIGEVIIRLGEGVVPQTIAAVLRAVRAVS